MCVIIQLLTSSSSSLSPSSSSSRVSCYPRGHSALTYAIERIRPHALSTHRWLTTSPGISPSPHPPPSSPPPHAKPSRRSVLHVKALMYTTRAPSTELKARIDGRLLSPRPPARSTRRGVDRTAPPCTAASPCDTVTCFRRRCP